ncbi:PBP1A family penicillin-binding protein [Bacillus salacetis]|uniref:PBP1A family penicillin-binding protein n=1 Tax=Bacillus salacetis TaxID=2315464 RepID=A0A3A1QZT5_9BACI|nr:PBP1A family penicillin-binding protein [Bacillus salacetis]RIW33113.1 PBP1A family penicillin-binding protein [Bacillus salacetis]
MSGQYKSREEKRLAQQKAKGKGKTKGKGKKKSFFAKAIISLFIIGIIGMLSGAGLFAYYASKAPKLDESLLKDPIASEIYDMNGDLITTVGTEQRDYVNYDQIPPLMEDAILATEDNRFYKHNGIDLIRLGGAVIANVTNGFGSEGASTLTQQVIKGSFLTPEKTLERKAQEAWLAVKLEQDYTKQEIFEMYFNKVYMSSGINGFGTAATHYFGKELKDLELHEAALLAGMPQSPNNYNPFDYPEKAEKRRNIVLSLMNQHGKITKEEMEKAQAVPVTDSLVSEETREERSVDKYEAFVDVVIDEVAELGDYNLFTDGLKVYTTVDPNAQQRVEAILAGEAIDFAYPDRFEEIMQAGITLLDTKTGEIRAIGGGRGYGEENKRGFNFAADAKRQPGSTIKPLLDYGPAIENLKWSTYHQIKDEPYQYTDTDININNWDKRFKGNISIREALWDSRNVPAVKALQEVGLEEGGDFLRGLGINFENTFEAYALGGTPGVNSIQMAGAYAAFGNGGVYNKPHSVTKIVLRDGETEVNVDPEPKTAMKDYTAYMITDMLKDVLKPGATGVYANVPGLAMAGKSGTTNYTDEDRSKYNVAANEAPDSWFVGYTTNYTASVWTGYSDRKYPLNPQERHIAQHIVKDLMSYVSQDIDTPDFKKPKSVVEAPVEKGSAPARLPSDYTPEDKITYELFVRGTEPSKVSEQYDKLPGPSGLKAEFDDDKKTITLTWDYKDEDRKPSFEVKGSFNGEEAKVLSTTSEKGLIVENIAADGTYSFTVTAVEGEQRSEPAAVTYTVQNQEIPEDEQEEEGTEDNPEDEENQDGNDEENQGEDGEGNGGNGNEEGQGGDNEDVNNPPAEDNGGDENDEGNGEVQSQGNGNAGNNSGNNTNNQQ